MYEHNHPKDHKRHIGYVSPSPFILYPFTPFFILHKKTITLSYCVTCSLTSSSNSQFPTMMRSVYLQETWFMHLSESAHPGREADLWCNHDDMVGMPHGTCGSWWTCLSPANVSHFASRTSMHTVTHTMVSWKWTVSAVRYILKKRLP